jgi:multidrug transporter EmrE-like cation transporter
MPYVTVFGKIATWVDIGAFLLAGAGVIWDRKKAASLAALFLTIISAGLIGMYVYNI